MEPKLDRFRPMRKLIGNTPLLSLFFTVNGQPRTIYAKYEPLNLTGSIKDRMALHILDRAGQQGGRRLPRIDRARGCDETAGAAHVPAASVRERRQHRRPRPRHWP